MPSGLLIGYGVTRATSLLPALADDAGVGALVRGAGEGFVSAVSVAVLLTLVAVLTLAAGTLILLPSAEDTALPPLPEVPLATGAAGDDGFEGGVIAAATA